MVREGTKHGAKTRTMAGKNKKASSVMKLKLFFGSRICLRWFQPEYLAIAKHTPGPDTRFFPVRLTGDGRKME